MTARCYCIFEGGGAKGIAHIGALKAITNSGIRPEGFAGTSAGAIIAALAAVGYTADDLFSAQGSILNDLDEDRSNIWSGSAHWPIGKPTRLFGRAGWLAIRLARKISPAPTLLALLGILMLGPVMAWLGLLTPNASLLVSAGSLGAIALVGWLLAAGLASLRQLEWAINQALSLRLAHARKLEHNHRGRGPESITFKQLRDAGCPTLKIVATDISEGKLALFSASMTPNASVAAAVAASVCLPVIFRPWAVDGRLHLDGGLVSNLPAWAFDEERAVDQDAWTAVVEVGAKKEENAKAPRGIGVLTAAVSTGLFGANNLNIRNVDRLRSVRLGVDLKLLQFDLDRENALKVIENARELCVSRLVYEIEQLPSLMRDICRRLAIRAERTINRALATQDRTPFQGRLRAGMLLPMGEENIGLLMEYGYGFDQHTDERIRLPLESSFAGHALTDDEPLYIESRDAVWNDYLSRPQDRCIRKLVSENMKWCLCVPHWHRRSDTRFVVGIDSDSYVDLPPDLVDVTMGSISAQVTRILNRYLPREAFRNARTESDEADRVVA